MDGEHPGGYPPADWTEQKVDQESLGLIAVWCVHNSDFNDPQK